LLAFTFLGLDARPASAQVLYGSIVGNVTDAQGGVIPGATVTITNRNTNLTRDTVTSADGTYTLPNLVPGSYDVKVALEGFREFVQTNVPVTAGQIGRIDVRLVVGALTETVTVTSDAQLLQTDKADLHTVLKPEAGGDRQPPAEPVPQLPVAD
jgi:hypothetical protein